MAPMPLILCRRTRIGDGHAHFTPARLITSTAQRPIYEYVGYIAAGLVSTSAAHMSDTLRDASTSVSAKTYGTWGDLKTGTS